MNDTIQLVDKRRAGFVRIDREVFEYYGLNDTELATYGWFAFYDYQEKGSYLSVTKLAYQFNRGKPAIRDAIAKLEHKKLIENSGKKTDQGCSIYYILDVPIVQRGQKVRENTYPIDPYWPDDTWSNQTGGGYNQTPIKKDTKTTLKQIKNNISGAEPPPSKKSSKLSENEKQTIENQITELLQLWQTETCIDIKKTEKLRKYFYPRLKESGFETLKGAIIEYANDPWYKTHPSARNLAKIMSNQPELAIWIAKYEQSTDGVKETFPNILEKTNEEMGLLWNRTAVRDISFWKDNLDPRTVEYLFVEGVQISKEMFLAAMSMEREFKLWLI